MHGQQNIKKKNLSHFLFVHFKTHMDWTGIKLGPTWRLIERTVTWRRLQL